MSATYNQKLVTTRDWVRFLLGDRNVSSPRFQDEEIDAVLVEQSDNKYLAAAELGEILLMRGGPMISKTVEDLRIEYSDSAEGAFARYIKKLRGKGTGTSGQAFFRAL